MGRITGNLGLIVATGLLIFAAIQPMRRAAAFEEVRATAIAEVANLKGAAERRIQEYSNWPTPAGPGAIPLEVGAAFPGDSLLGGESYTMTWSLVELVGTEADPIDDLPAEAIAVLDSIPQSLTEVVRTAGMISVTSQDERLLAALLADFGSSGAFVTDTVWALVLPPPGA